VYALAALSYQALTGSPPFPGESVVEVEDARRHEPVRPMAEVAGVLPAALAGAVERALEPSRDRRFPSAEAFAEALLPGGAAPLIAEAGPPADPARARTFTRRRPAGLTIAIVVAAILVAAGVAVPTLIHRVGFHRAATTHLLVEPASSPALPSPAIPIVEAPSSSPPSPSPPPPPSQAVRALPPRPKPSPTPPKPASPAAASVAAPPASHVASPPPTPPTPLPARGQRIAFTGTGSGKPSIYVTDLTGSVLIRLTNSPTGDDSQPAWSPDGSKIAFTSTRDGSRQVYVMTADGTNQRRLTAGTANNYDPAWDPTGATIAYTSEANGRPQIYEVGELGGRGIYAGPTPAENYTSAFSQPAWSPDGKTMAATVARGSGSVIETWTITGGATTVLNPYVPWGQNPSWSPDGSRILSSDGLGPTLAQIYAMAPDGAGQAILTGSAGGNQEPRFSPAGNRIAFVTGRTGGRQVWTMGADGSQQAPLVGAGESYDPSWG
jgi:hypothetical protein